MKACKAFTSAMALSAMLVVAAGDIRAHEAGHEGHDHSVAKHDHRPVAGGIVTELGDYDGELVTTTDGRMTLLLKDHDGKEAGTEGFKASVLILTGSERQGPFDLAPAGGNKLEGAGAALKAGSKAIVTLTDKSGKAAQGRFEAK